MADIAINASWFASLAQYMDQLQADTTAAAESAVSFLHDKVVEKAREMPEWSDLADEITVWSKDGYLYVGIANEERVSEAMALEYGDEVRPPSSLFRALSEEVEEATKRHQDEMKAKGYVYGAGIYGAPK